MSTVRVIVEIKGGAVQGIYSNGQNVNISILDHDLGQVEEGHEEREKRLEEEIKKKLFPVYYDDGRV